MLIAYLDEFGHVGPYIEDGHPKYGQHPVFGYGGFVIPASNARAIGAEFKRVKTSLFKTEIDKSATPAQWERKGSEFFSTGSVTKRPELIRAFRSLLVQLRRLDGQLFYYGDEKATGTLKETGVSALDVTRNALQEAVNRISRHAQNQDDDVLVLTDAITDKTRQELAAQMYAHIYTRKKDEMRRIVEAPLHIESKLNSGIQMADWICGLLGRAAHFQLVHNSEFKWASEQFNSAAQGSFTYESKLYLKYGRSIHNSEILAMKSARNIPLPAQSLGAKFPDLVAMYHKREREEAERRRAGGPGSHSASST